MSDRLEKLFTELHAIEAKLTLPPKAKPAPPAPSFPGAKVKAALAALLRQGAKLAKPAPSLREKINAEPSPAKRQALRLQNWKQLFFK